MRQDGRPRRRTNGRVRLPDHRGGSDRQLLRHSRRRRSTRCRSTPGRRRLRCGTGCSPNSKKPSVNGQDRDLRIVVVGGGATGVETGRRVGRASRTTTCPSPFPSSTPARTHITLVEQSAVPAGAVPSEAARIRASVIAKARRRPAARYAGEASAPRRRDHRGSGFPARRRRRLGQRRAGSTTRSRSGTSRRAAADGSPSTIICASTAWTVCSRSATSPSRPATARYPSSRNPRGKAARMSPPS